MSSRRRRAFLSSLCSSCSAFCPPLLFIFHQLGALFLLDLLGKKMMMMMCFFFVHKPINRTKITRTNNNNNNNDRKELTTFSSIT